MESLVTFEKHVFRVLLEFRDLLCDRSIRDLPVIFAQQFGQGDLFSGFQVDVVENLLGVRAGPDLRLVDDKRQGGFVRAFYLVIHVDCHGDEILRLAARFQIGFSFALAALFGFFEDRVDLRLDFMVHAGFQLRMAGVADRRRLDPNLPGVALLGIPPEGEDAGDIAQHRNPVDGFGKSRAGVDGDDEEGQNRGGADGGFPPGHSVPRPRGGQGGADAPAELGGNRNGLIKLLCAAERVLIFRTVEFVVLHGDLLSQRSFLISDRLSTVPGPGKGGISPCSDCCASPLRSAPASGLQRTAG